MGQPKIRVVSAEIQREGLYLLTQRPAHAVLPSLWEFPGGRVRDGDTDQQTLQRALVQRIGCNATVGEQLLEVTHPYEHYDLTLVVYRCEIGSCEPTPASVAAIKWVAPEDFDDYPFPGADQKTVDALLG